MKIAKNGPNWDKLTKPLCYACNGSGYYDNTNRYGKVPRCASCDGTGEREE